MASPSKPAKTPGRGIVQAPRLSEQVYTLLKEDLINASFAPGQRLVERDLSERYSVSRTPIRDALARLSREGLLEEGNDRGYAVPLDAQRDILDRLEVRQLLEAQIVRRAAKLAEPKEIKNLQKCYERELAAHESNQHRKFIDAHQHFKEALRNISGNRLLNHCAAIVDDTFQLARDHLLEQADNRLLAVTCDGEIVEAVRLRDEKAAVAALQRFIDSLHTHFQN